MAEYEPVSWVPGDNLDAEKFQQMSENDQFLFENVFETEYNGYGVRRNEGLKILTGVVAMPARDSLTTEVDVAFPSYFGVGCSPVVVATCSTRNRVRSMVTVRGRGGQKNPDHLGFHITLAHQLGVNLKYDNPDEETSRIQHVHWIAIGY